MTKRLDQMHKMLQDTDQEQQFIVSEVDELKLVANEYLTKKDGLRFWRQLQRFAEYEDLKDLYGKVVPEISKFEQKIIDVEGSLKNNNIIIRQFDENITSKCDKLLLE